MRVIENRTENYNRKNTKKHLLQKIKEYDFALIETSLFLNTHPHNTKALTYYTKLRNEREKYALEFEKIFGPITFRGNMSEKNWLWVNGPWPWEGDC